VRLNLTFGKVLSNFIRQQLEPRSPNEPPSNIIASIKKIAKTQEQPVSQGAYRKNPKGFFLKGLSIRPPMPQFGFVSSFILYVL